MRVLLDECFPQSLARHLVGHEVSTVVKEGWGTLKNGVLLASAEVRWDVLLTTDKNIPWQQSVARFQIAVLVVRAFANSRTALEPFMPDVLAKLPELKPGTVAFVGEPKLLNK